MIFLYQYDADGKLESVITKEKDAGRTFLLRVDGALFAYENCAYRAPTAAESAQYLSVMRRAQGSAPRVQKYNVLLPVVEG